MKLEEFLNHIWKDTQVVIHCGENVPLNVVSEKALILRFDSAKDKMRYVNHYKDKELSGIKAIAENKLAIYVY